jgi:hypothetical protein
VCVFVCFIFLPSSCSVTIRLESKGGLAKASFFVRPSQLGRGMSVYVYGLKSRRESRNISFYFCISPFIFYFWLLFGLAYHITRLAFCIFSKDIRTDRKQFFFFVARILTDFFPSPFTYFFFRFLLSFDLDVVCVPALLL